MMSIDPARWNAAVDATERHRNQVQTFLYRHADADPVENGRRAGVHVVRDCTLAVGNQEIFREVDLTGRCYDEISARARDARRLYETCIVIAEYEGAKRRGAYGQVGQEPDGGPASERSEHE